MQQCCETSAARYEERSACRYSYEYSKRKNRGRGNGIIRNDWISNQPAAAGAQNMETALWATREVLHHHDGKDTGVLQRVSVPMLRPDVRYRCNGRGRVAQGGKDIDATHGVESRTPSAGTWLNRTRQVARLLGCTT